MRSFIPRSTLAIAVRQIGTQNHFDAFKTAPPDPVFSVVAAYQNDASPQKVNLAIGVYRDENNKPVVMECIQKASKKLVYDSMDYTDITGIPSFVQKSSKLAFGTVLPPERIASCQTVSGSGALRVSGDLISHFMKGKKVLLPTPTYVNHLPVFKECGIKDVWYKYYEPKTKSLDINGMLSDLEKADEGDVVLFHACAHNPTGLDPTHEEWVKIISVVKKRNLLPMIDMAYQGFATGDLERDGFLVHKLAKEVPNMLVCQSFSKSFGLYGQRAGCLHVVCKDKDERDRVFSQFKTVIRPLWTSPPLHGARLMETVIDDPELTELWKKELMQMSQRMANIRVRFVEELKKAGSTLDWSHITRQIGMMAYTGLTKEQVLSIRKQHVYMTEDGRAALCGMNNANVVHCAKAFHDVTK